MGVWYAPFYDKANRAPLTPTVYILQEDNRPAQNGGTGLQTQAVFESLRIQVGEGNGISCLLRPQYEPNCCGRARLMWSIYETGMKAKEELSWQPTNWIEPECSKPASK